MCEEWQMREHLIPTNYLGDVYDGCIWKNFSTNFLSIPYSYLLCLNVDWFQPFKHTQYSIGAIYVTIQNLPRERFKQENVVLIEIIAGPKEPSLSIDLYLQPLVSELNEYYSKGFLALTPFNTHIRIHLALHATFLQLAKLWLFKPSCQTRVIKTSALILFYLIEVTGN